MKLDVKKDLGKDCVLFYGFFFPSWKLGAHATIQKKKNSIRRIRLIKAKLLSQTLT